MLSFLFRGARTQSQNPPQVPVRRRSFVPRLDVLEGRSVPATLTVTTLADSGPGSLRDAVAVANASPGPDAIDFAPGLGGTIGLSGTLEITDGLTVRGPGADTLSLNGSHSVQVLRVAAGAAADISGLTVAGGWDTQGGGIRNDGSLSLDRVTVWGNEAGAGSIAGSGGGIYNAHGARLAVTRSTISNNLAHTIGLDGGGGISNGGTLSVSATNFSGNEVWSGNIGNGGNGGALYNFSRNGITPTAIIDSCTFTANRNNSISSSGSLTLRRSTVSGDAILGVECSGTTTIDSCTVTGNGIAPNVYGGGIHTGGSFTLVNSTVAGNQGAGLTVLRGTSTSPTSVALANCTIAGNIHDSPASTNSGAGIDVTGNGTSPLITLHNTIVAGNAVVTSGGQPIAKDLNTSTQTTILVRPPRYVSLGYNLIQAPGTATITGTGTGDLYGVDPLLRPLQYNGGPTPTMALLAGSPALDAGDPALAGGTDQRGGDYARVCNGRADVGAFELQPAPHPRPSVSIGDASGVEGNAGTVALFFTVTLNAPSPDVVAVEYATTDGTATAGSDYSAAAGTLAFRPGEIRKTVAVTVLSDRVAEPDETFAVNLTNPQMATVAGGAGVETIRDDEPRLSIGDVSKLEGKRSETTVFTFTVTLSAAYDQAVTVSFGAANGTATTADNDYVAKSGTLTFLPGETTKTVTIEVKGDSTREVDEYFYLDLFGNSTNTLFTRGRGTGTILNDD